MLNVLNPEEIKQAILLALTEGRISMDEHWSFTVEPHHRLVGQRAVRVRFEAILILPGRPRRG